MVQRLQIRGRANAGVHELQPDRRNVPEAGQDAQAGVCVRVPFRQEQRQLDLWPLVLEGTGTCIPRE